MWPRTSFELSHVPANGGMTEASGGPRAASGRGSGTGQNSQRSVRRSINAKRTCFVVVAPIFPQPLDLALRREPGRPLRRLFVLLGMLSGLTLDVADSLSSFGFRASSFWNASQGTLCTTNR